MIEFLTLFAGLVLGVQNVEVAVSGPVARVELRLNEEVLADIVGPPWIARVDLGRELHPAVLEAVAFDAAGRELDRAGQRINLPGRRAEAEIVSIRDEDGRVSSARLTWSSPEFSRPKKIAVELDGRSLKVRSPYRIDLSGVDGEGVHVLSAEFQFSGDLVIKRELVFGSEFTGDHDSGLTAVAVVLDELDELPPPEALEGWFVRDGEPLEVTAVEIPDAHLVVVRDPTAVHALAEMSPELDRRRKKSRRDSSKQRTLDIFGDDVEISVLSPEPVPPPDREPAAMLFPYSNKPAPGSKGIVSATVGSAPASLLGGPLMMSDAVAVAAMRAAEGNRRRMVVLMLGKRREDGSRFSPGTARRYLEDLRVPLVVWDLTGPSEDPPTGWGDLKPVDNVDDLVRQVRRLRYRLGEQRIVWLRGTHLPQQIELTDRARGVSLAR
jgi:hypothetical protein